jgi:hypothetical protein
MIRVLFFGGFESTPADVYAWAISAKVQRHDAAFNAWPYPQGAGAGAQDALDGFTNERFDKVIALIRQNPGDLHYVVGHSSGCAISNAVVRGLGDPPVPDLVKLIALDGFPPDDALYAIHPDTECWSAKCDTARSLNWDACSPRPNFHAYQAKDCYDKWPLHFSLVNTNASDATVGNISQGYAGCVANLCWLSD